MNLITVDRLTRSALTHRPVQAVRLQVHRIAQLLSVTVQCEENTHFRTHAHCTE